MNPKSGKAGSAVSPMEPKSAILADVADPGEMAKMKVAQRQTQTGKYGSTPVKPHQAPLTEEEKETQTSWIEIKLVDDEGQAVPGEQYRITLPDDSVVEGTLDERGRARVEGIDPGNCRVTFPKLDRTAWRKQ